MDGHLLADEGQFGWCLATASVPGTSHSRRELPCQDAYKLSHCAIGDEVITVLLAADGAGSALHAALGSEMACSHFLDYFEAWCSSHSSICEFNYPTALQWLNAVQEQIKDASESIHANINDFATTFLAAVIGSSVSIFIQIGDGAIVRDDPDDEKSYCWIFWPEESEYANSTHFITDARASDHLLYTTTTYPVHKLAVFTDGLQRLALHIASKSVHDPFFEAMFTTLEQHCSESSQNSEWLASFLSSNAVSRRTDDDVTLLLAARR